MTTLRVKSTLKYEYKTHDLVAFASDTFGSIFLQRPHWEEMGRPFTLTVDLLAGNHLDNIYTEVVDGG